MNSNVVAEKLGSASEEVRQEVHEATAPKEAAAPEPTPPPAEPAAPAPAPQTP